MLGEVDVRIFAKPSTRPSRRMGVTLALADAADRARKLAASAASKLKIIYK